MTTVGVFIDTGSAYENVDNNGVAHFVEHMTFKGSKKRSQVQLEMEVENRGASVNAYTSREQTAYFLKTFSNDVQFGIDLVSDILQNPLFPEARIEHERSVILREAEEVSKDLQEVILDNVHALAFQDSTLGYTILGPEKNILSLTRKDLQQYIQTHYSADRMVVAACGDIQHEEIVKLAASAFQQLPHKSAFDLNALSKQQFHGGVQAFWTENFEEDAYLGIAVEGTSWMNADMLTMMIIHTLLGSYNRGLFAGRNVSSPLSSKIGQENMAQVMNTFNTCYNHTGLFGAYVQTPMKNIEIVSETILREWARLGHALTDEEVQRAKNKLKATLVMQLDGTTAIFEDIGRQLLSVKRRLSVAEIFLRIDSIDAESVRRVARKYLIEAPKVVIGIGALKQFPSYEQFMHWSQWQ